MGEWVNGWTVYCAAHPFSYTRVMRPRNLSLCIHRLSIHDPSIHVLNWKWGGGKLRLGGLRFFEAGCCFHVVFHSFLSALALLLSCSFEMSIV